eukprot:753841_1
MKIVIIWLLLGVALGIECVKQAAAGTLAQVGGIDIDVDAVASTCDLTASCGSIISSGAYQITGAAPYASSWIYNWEQKGCFDCAALNLNDKCITANYDFSTTVTASCIPTSVKNYQSNVSISCCSTSRCNAQVATSQCRPDPDFSQYMKSLQTCWNTAYPSLIQATCDDPTLSGYIDRCVPAQGTSASSTSYLTKQNCTYRTTCTQPIQDAITTFAECGCKVSSGQYSKQFIQTLMANDWIIINWKQYCKNLNFDCDANPIVSEKQWYVQYKIWVNLSKTQLPPAVQAIITNKIAIILNVNEDLLTITITVKERRRLLADESVVTVTFQSDDKDIAEYAEDKFNDEQLATDIGIAIGAETTMIGVTTEDPYDSSTTTQPDTSSTTTQPDTSSTPQHTVYWYSNWS